LVIESFELRNQRPDDQVLVAVTREVSESIGQCELTHLPRQVIDVDRARAQHRSYERALEEAGCTIVRVEAAPELPDSVFVEDAAVVLSEVAIIMRPGARPRRAETPAVAELVGHYRPLRFIEAPGTIDGGDVLVAGRSVFVGLSGRTNEAAVEQMRAILRPHGYAVRPVPVTGCLHLKSAVTALADDRLLLNGEWVARELFSSLDLDIVDVDSAEPYAANIVRVAGELVYPDAFPRTRERLERQGARVRTVDVSEIAKAEGAATCCSLIFPGDAAAVRPKTPR
jgi:dimethylargininase